MTRTQFEEPSSIYEAKSRKRVLEAQIADIGRQLADTQRKRGDKAMPAQDYVQWKMRTRYALNRKEAEQVYLKDWILDRRRQLTGQKLDIEDVDDPIDIIVAARSELLSEKPRLGLLLDVIEQFLTHSA